MKLKAAQESGMTVNHVQIPSDAESGEIKGTGVAEIEKLVKHANGDPKVSGLLVQLPLEGATQEEERKIVELVGVGKDVDGFHPENIGNLSSRLAQPLFTPCTPAGVIKLIDSSECGCGAAWLVVMGHRWLISDRRDAFVFVPARSWCQDRWSQRRRLGTIGYRWNPCLCVVEEEGCDGHSVSLEDSGIGGYRECAPPSPRSPSTGCFEDDVADLWCSVTSQSSSSRTPTSSSPPSARPNSSRENGSNPAVSSSTSGPTISPIPPRNPVNVSSVMFTTRALLRSLPTSPLFPVVLAP